MDEKIELLKALLMAVNEAEGWYDECRSLKKGERIEALEPCYALLDEAGYKTKNAKD